MIKGEYPQYEWYENLQKSLRALAGKKDSFNGELLEKARKSYKIIQEFQETAVHIVELIETNKKYKKFRNTAIYHSCKRDIPLLQEILEKYKVIEESS